MGHLSAENGLFLDRVLHDLSLTCHFSDNVSLQMFIKVKCLILGDSRCHFRLLIALPVKNFQIAIFSTALWCTCTLDFVDISCF